MVLAPSEAWITFPPTLSTPPVSVIAPPPIVMMFVSVATVPPMVRLASVKSKAVAPVPFTVKAPPTVVEPPKLQV